MGKIIASSPVFERINLLRHSKEIVAFLSDALTPLFEEIGDTAWREDWDRVLQGYRDTLDNPDITLEEARKTDKDLVNFLQRIQDVFVPIQDGHPVKVEILQEEDGTPRRVLQQFSLQAPDSTQGRRDLLADLDNIRKSSKSGVVKISKDLWKSQIQSPGDSLEFIKDEKIKKRIQKKAEEGKFLTGTLVGLSGGSAYFKVFCLAIAQTLNEQSKYFKTEGDLSGVPKDLLSQYAGEGMIVDKIKDPSPVFKGGERPFPIALFIWEDLAKKMSPTGVVAGGKDIKVVRDYVLGGITRRKDKSGKEVKTYTPGLLGREYLIEGQNGIVGVPFMTKLLSLYSKDSPDKEIGIAVQLSPLFTLKNLIGYTGIRTDTIQLLGGGRQRELTLNLFIFLAYYRGVPAQSGRNKGEFVQRKKELLQEISKGLSSYTGRPGLLEKHFQEAVQKCIDAKILLPGKTKTALRGYREEVNPGGQTLSIFTYNPDYLKGEEITLFSETEDQ